MEGVKSIERKIIFDSKLKYKPKEIYIPKKITLFEKTLKGKNPFHIVRNPNHPK